MKVDKRRRTHCIVCERELPKITKRGRKRKRIMTCSPNCSKTFVRIRIYALNNIYYNIRRIKILEEKLKRK